MSLQCHYGVTTVSLQWHYSVTTVSQRCHNIVTTVSQQCHYSVTTVSLQCHYDVTTVSQQCHYSVTTVSQQCHYSVTTVSQLKMCDFSGETFKGFEVLYFFMSETTTQLLSSVEFANCVMILNLLKVHLQTFLSKPITQKCQILICDTLVANQYVSCLCAYKYECVLFSQIRCNY